MAPTPPNASRNRPERSTAGGTTRTVAPSPRPVPRACESAPGGGRRRRTASRRRRTRAAGRCLRRRRRRAAPRRPAPRRTPPGSPRPSGDRTPPGGRVCRPGELPEALLGGVFDGERRQEPVLEGDSLRPRGRVVDVVGLGGSDCTRSRISPRSPCGGIAGVASVQVGPSAVSTVPGRAPGRHTDGGGRPFVPDRREGVRRSIEHVASPLSGW